MSETDSMLKEVYDAVETSSAEELSAIENLLDKYNIPEDDSVALRVEYVLRVAKWILT